MTLPADLKSWLETHGQQRLLEHLDRLGEAERHQLVRDLEAMDRDEVAGLIAAVRSDAATSPPARVEPLDQVEKGADPTRDATARERGLELLAAGRVAAFVVAGGQGTRLGHEGPKGTYPATPIRGRSLFAHFADKLLGLSRIVGRPVPLWVMTSPGNHRETIRYFEAHDRFGLAPDALRFLTQGTMPAVDTAGNLLLAAPQALFRSPDGHGGSLRALRASGALEEMAARGIEEIFYFQVDNPLVEVCDPVFLGYHREVASAFSSKSVRKTAPGEKVGVLARLDGRPGVIEYSDLTEELRAARDPDGSLRLRAGNIAVHALRRGFVEELTEGRFRLPFHFAKKEIPCVGPSGAPERVTGIKFETFVFDALPLADRTLVLEVEREAEFSPIKNREGGDSPETSRRDQVRLHARWLEAVGVRVPRDPEGEPRHAVEISPRFAPDLESLRRRTDALPDEVADDLVVEDA